MNKINYQKETDKIIQQIERGNSTPSLLLHSCCAPCSSYTLEYLSKYFNITILYFNPNIFPEDEFDKRFHQQLRLVEQMGLDNVTVVKGDYNYNRFLDIAKGYEHIAEGAERCFRCYRLRLEESARYAKDNGYDYYCTTLSISPLKNSAKINEIGEDVAQQYGVKWLPSDFKKREGYKRSIELSKIYDLYRQNYCGCVYSKRDDIMVKEEK